MFLTFTSLIGTRAVTLARRCRNVDVAMWKQRLMAGSQSNFDFYVDVNVTFENTEGYGRVRNVFDVRD